LLNNPWSGNPTQRKAPPKPGSIANPFAGGTGIIPPPGKWKAGNPGAATFHGGFVAPGLLPAQGGGGGNPMAGILADYLNQMRGDMGAESAADKGGMINQLRRYVISYGALPDFAQLGGLGADAQGYLQEAMDPATMALAQKAEAEGVSSHARLAHGNEIATRRIPAGLAARGMLQSGQTGADLGEQALQYKTSGYDMLNEMLSGIQGGVSGFQNNERARQRQLADMEMQAAMQAAQDWGNSYFDPGGSDPTSPAAAAVQHLQRPKITAATRPWKKSGSYAVKAM